jgi:DNA topoisomerase-3
LPENQYEESQYVIESISKALPTLHEIAKNVDFTIKSKIWNAEKTTAHHGIVPTTNSSVNALTGDEAKLYEIIARNYIAQFYPAHEYNSVSIETTVKDYKFISKGKEITVLGWKSVYSEVEEDEQEPTLPAVNTNDNAICQKCTIEKAQTKPPKHFTEGTLIKAMENVYKYVDDPEFKKELKDGDGIGTSATRASIIETLKARNYLTIEKKHIVSTDLAAEFLNFITKEIQSPIMTALYERDLTAIAQGRKSIDEFMSNCIDFVENEVIKARINVRVEENTVKEMDITCPFCGEHIIQDNYSYKCKNENCFKLKKNN